MKKVEELHKKVMERFENRESDKMTTEDKMTTYMFANECLKELEKMDKELNNDRLVDDLGEIVMKKEPKPKQEIKSKWFSRIESEN